MSETDYELERRYLIDERLGMMCGANEPTQEQRRLAEEYADLEIQHIKDFDNITKQSS